MDYIFETQSLTKKFGHFTAVSDVSLKIRPQTIHAIAGENGAGKSTLMKLLFGMIAPSSGEIFYQSKKISWSSPMEAFQAKVGMVQQHFSLVPNLSVLENIVLGNQKHRGLLNHQSVIPQIEKFLPDESWRLPWSEPVENLTIGSQQRVEILKVLYRDIDVLILDEPTAVLTPQETEALYRALQKLKAQGKTIILITHRLHEIFNYADEVSVLRGGQLISHQHVQDTSIEKTVEAMIGHPQQSLKKVHSTPGKIVLSCHQLRETTTTWGALENVNLEIKENEILGVAGVDGSGQKNLVEILLNLRPYEGQVQWFSQEHKLTTKELRKKGLSLIPQDRLQEGLWPEQALEQNILIGYWVQFSQKGWIKFNLLQKKSLAWTKIFDVKFPTLKTPVKNLSGGNQQKLIFARELMGRKTKLLICHEPTRGVDIGAAHFIHQKILELKEQGTAILVISSDLEELMTLSDRILVLYKGKSVSQYKAPYSTQKIGASMMGVSS